MYGLTEIRACQALDLAQQQAADYPPALLCLFVIQTAAGVVCNPLRYRHDIPNLLPPTTAQFQRFIQQENLLVLREG